MANIDEIDVLRYFNEKVNKLLQLTFTDFVTSKQVKLKLSAKRGEEVKVEHILPGGESFDAFVLTFRFFIQNNEPISIGNMAELYSRLPISEDLKQKFADARIQYNSFLDRNSPLVFKNPNTEEEKRFTYREIMDIFIYGGLAHGKDKKKRELFERIMSKPIFNKFALLSFTNILTNSLTFLNFVKSINEKAISELKNK
ncbi:MAG: hypothetical protein ACTSQE_04775 [Candidatus Heimdallarchaeaceae archaeon]